MHTQRTEEYNTIKSNNYTLFFLPVIFSPFPFLHRHHSTHILSSDSIYLFYLHKKERSIFVFMKSVDTTFPVASHEDSEGGMKFWDSVLTLTFGTTRRQSCQLYAPAVLYSQGDSLVLISVRV